MTDLTRLSASALADLLSAGEVSSVEATRAHLDRIESVDADVHAFLHVSAENAIRTAVRRGIIDAEGSALRLTARSVEDYDRAFLKDQFLASLAGRAWTERADAPVQFARWLGYRRTGPAIEDMVRSLINGLIRTGRLEADGDRIRRV